MKIAITSRKYFKLSARKREWLRTYQSSQHETWAQQAELDAELLRLSEPIFQALKAVNNRAREHTIHSWEQVVGLAIEAEKRLELDGVTLKNRPGTVLSYTPAGPWAKAYGNPALTTSVHITRGSSDWFLTLAKLATVWPQQKVHKQLDISKAAGADITKQAFKGYRVGAYEDAIAASRQLSALIESISEENSE